jgi:glycosyltransferase involved in cell wall biosynthesis
VKRKIFLLYPYYYPHYKAGGPVQSLFNLVSFFKEDAQFYLLSNELDIDGSKSSTAFKLSQWNSGPNGESVFYLPKITPAAVYQKIKEVRPDVILVNGLFDWNTTLSGIVAAKQLGIKLIISPRGMLQEWGLKRNALVKKVYLQLLKVLLSKRESWHATDDQEKKDILKHFGPHQSVSIALNIPKPVSEPVSVAFPSATGRVNVVFLSLINPNKNLHLVIQALQNHSSEFSLDIYGPIINTEYWEECKKHISSDSITYKGPLPAWEVTKVLQQYHFFILPTQGENFGHAIFDSISVGTPVIISKFTPWNLVQDSKAGFYIDLNQQSIEEVLAKVKSLSQEQYSTLRNTTITYGRTYWKGTNYKQDYRFLFN